MILCKRRCAVTKNGVLAMERGSTTAFMCRCNTAAVMKYRTFMLWVLPKIVNSTRLKHTEINFLNNVINFHWLLNSNRRY